VRQLFFKLRAPIFSIILRGTIGDLQETVADVSGEFSRSLDLLERGNAEDPDVVILDKQSVIDTALSQFL